LPTSTGHWKVASVPRSGAPAWTRGPKRRSPPCQAAVERKARRDSAGKRKAARGDMPRIIAGGLKERSEVTGGENVRLAERQRTEALEQAATARERIEILQPLWVVLPQTRLPATKVVLTMDKVTAGYEPDRPVIRNLSFAIAGPERIAVTGPTGSGKTTLLALVAGRLKPWSGTVRVATSFAMLDQRVSLLDPKTSIRDNFRRLDPAADENACRAALSRFMFRGRCGAADGRQPERRPDVACRPSLRAGWGKAALAAHPR
jgi:ATPase subunit of ABC transporter with duplicated ATPase domains